METWNSLLVAKADRDVLTARRQNMGDAVFDMLLQRAFDTPDLTIAELCTDIDPETRGYVTTSRCYNMDAISGQNNK